MGWAVVAVQLLLDLGTWLLTVAITLVGLAALTFFIGRVLPIDPVLSIVGEKANPEVYQRVFLERLAASGHRGLLAVPGSAFAGPV